MIHQIEVIHGQPIRLDTFLDWGQDGAVKAIDIINLCMRMFLIGLEQPTMIVLVKNSFTF